jgi:periplasmic glucans biosynthesis protein
MFFSFWACLGASFGHSVSFAGSRFSFSDVIAEAERMAHKAYQPPPPLPAGLRNLTLNQWRDIVFRKDKSPWPGNVNFRLQFYHLGYLYKKPVKINIIDLQGVHQFPFTAGLFSYGDKKTARMAPDNLGFAGFSLYYPFNRHGNYDEILVFIGGSYFRALGKNQWFGLSARGIAVDLESPEGEQFPYFKAFWIARPAAKSERNRYPVF